MSGKDEGPPLPWDPDTSNPWNPDTTANDEEYTNKSTADASEDVKRTAPAQALEEAQKQLSELHLRRVQRDFTSSWWFLITTGITVAIAVTGSIVAAIYLAVCGKFEGNVAIAFFAGFVAEVIGIAYIVARYFFPEGGGLTKMPREHD